MTSSSTEAGPTVFFSDGVVIDDTTCAFSAGFVDAPDAASSRILWLFEDGWAADDVEDDFIVSMTYSPTRNSFFALGRNGLVASVGHPGMPFSFDTACGNLHIGWIEAAAQRGVMSRIRAIGDGVYACGWGSQLYRLVNERWENFDVGLPPERRYGFLDLRGTAENDIYAVGMDGTIAHFDGKAWSVGSPVTNVNLLAIAVRSDGQAVLLGADGMILSGTADQWTDLSDPDVQGNFWSGEVFDDTLYIACMKSDTGLYRYTEQGLQPVAHGLPSKPTTHRLCAGGSQLWSVGEYDLLRFDGTSWTRVPCPDNE